MRIDPEEARLIQSIVQSVYGSNAQARLFGSRRDDQGCGGDYDLLVLCEDPTFEKTIQLKEKLTELFGARDVFDLVVQSLDEPESDVDQRIRKESEPLGSVQPH